MIVAVRIPDFEARVLQREKATTGQPVAVRDESRVISANPGARNLGVEVGRLVEDFDIPEEVEVLNFDLEALAEANREERESVQELSPLVETVGFGEFFVEVETGTEVEEGLSKILSKKYPLAVGGAATGWLALILARRQQAGEVELVPDDAYDEAVQDVTFDEMWGLGREVMGILEENGIKQMGELYYLSENDRRKLLGKHSRLFHKLFNREDPRPMSVFSRPRSLSREVSLPPDEAQDREQLRERVEPILEQLAARLEDSASLAHRLRIGVRFPGDEELVQGHVFTTPTCDPDLFSFAIDRIIADVALTTPAQSVAVEADVIVADLENYHSKPQEEVRDIEILDS